VLLFAQEVFPDDMQSQDISDRALRSGLAKDPPSPWDWSTISAGPGLMYGMSGWGYIYLRRACSTVPSALLLGRLGEGSHGTDRAARCLYCQSDQVTKRGKTAKGKQRYRCHNPGCAYQSFVLDPAFKRRLPRANSEWSRWASTLVECETPHQSDLVVDGWDCDVGSSIIPEDFTTKSGGLEKHDINPIGSVW